MQRFWRTALTLVVPVVVEASDAHAQRTLNPEESACFRCLFVEGRGNWEAQELLDRGWANRADDGTIFLTADGLEGGQDERAHP